MTTSPIITPFRWYSKFYEQERYDVDCHNECEFQLITDRGHLLPFQFKRDKSGSLIENWLLRSKCVDAEHPLLSEQSSKFYGDFLDQWTIDGLDCAVRTITTGSDRTLSDGSTRTLTVAYCETLEKKCNIFRSGSVSGVNLTLENLLEVGKKYKLYVTIGDIQLIDGSDLNINFFNGTAGNVNIIEDINALGCYEVEFTATSENIGFYVNSSAAVDQFDYIGIEQIQIVELFNKKTEDVELDISLLKLVNINDHDYFVYCGDSLGLSLPTGDNYSIITTDDGSVYYSEIITIKDFIPFKGSYYTLEWSNTCDIEDVLFQAILGCSYKNRLYLEEAVLAKPDHLIEEESEEDGDKNLIPTFQKWEKALQFIIAKCPGYIVDSLTSIRLHDTIFLAPPTRKEQLDTSEQIPIESVESDVVYVLDDCFATVTLRMLLPEKYIDSACCENNSITPYDCAVCNYETGRNVNDFVFDFVKPPIAFAFNHNIYPDGLYEFVFFVGWVLKPVSFNEKVCNLDSSFIYIDFGGGLWITVPILDNVIFNAGVYTVIGDSYAYSYADVEYSIDGGNSWILGAKGTIEELNVGIDVVLESTPGVLFRIRSYTLNCDYGYSLVYDFDNP